MFERGRLFLSLFKDTVALWSAHKAQRLGAALAYYTIFSLAPLLIIFIAIIGFVYGAEEAQAQLLLGLRGTIGLEGAAFISTMIASANRADAGLIPTLVGVVTLMFGAVGAFTQLQDAINTIWDVDRSKQSGIWRLFRDQLVSLAMVLGVGFLLLASLVASTVVITLGAYFGALLPVPALALEAVNLVLSVTVSTILFALIFKFLPDCPIGWSDVWNGALVTSLLFTVGKYLIAFYLSAGTVSSVYGAAGSLAVLLIWIYYSAQIILFGAEFTHVSALRDRSPAGVAAEQRAVLPRERKDG